MFDTSRWGVDPLTPTERGLSTLLLEQPGRARVRPDLGWPDLLWPDRVHEVTTGRHRLGPDPDELEVRRAAEVELLERGALHLDAARSAERELRRAAARRARALACFARARPAAELDRAPGEVGAASAASRAARPEILTEVSEWAADEAAVALAMSPDEASRLLEQCLVLDEQLAGTWAALEAGDIGWQHALVVVDVLRPMTTAAKRREAEQRLLARAGGKSAAQLRQAARRVVMRIDAAAVARRAARAVAGRQVRFSAGDDGMGTLEARMPLPVARACYNRLSAQADECRTEGDERSKDERRTDCLADLVLRPDATDRPPVQVSLTVVVPAATLRGGDEPGEVDGEPVPAAVVRELTHTLGLMPRPDAAPPEKEVAALGSLLGTRDTGGTVLLHRPHIAVVDELDGSLLALTDAAGLRRGEALGPPPESPGYRPGRALDRFVRLRDRRCRFPGCRARPRKCDLDHVVAHPLGPTSVCNLCALCEHHHRLKHQAPGWTLTGTADGGLTWTTPGGLQVTTCPPRFGADGDVGGSGAAQRARASSSGVEPAPDRVGGDRRSGGRWIPGILDLLRQKGDGVAGGPPPQDASHDEPPPF